LRRGEFFFSVKGLFRGRGPSKGLKFSDPFHPETPHPEMRRSWKEYLRGIITLGASIPKDGISRGKFSLMFSQVLEDPSEEVSERRCECIKGGSDLPVLLPYRSTVGPLSLNEPRRVLFRISEHSTIPKDGFGFRGADRDKGQVQ
jgi:hypothetical protein